MLYRSPVSHLVFSNKTEYQCHLLEVAYEREITWPQQRVLKNNFVAARTEFHKQSTFDDIMKWLRFNRESTVTAPMLGLNAISTSPKVFDVLEISGRIKFVPNVNTSLIWMHETHFETRIEGLSGWRVPIKLVMPRKLQGSTNAFTNQMRGLTALNFHIATWDYQPAEGGYINCDVIVLARDFPNLALIEKLKGGMAGPVTTFQLVDGSYSRV